MGSWCFSQLMALLLRPKVSRPSVRGVTSKRTTSLVSPVSIPCLNCCSIQQLPHQVLPDLPWLFSKELFTCSAIFGIRAIPPTITISLTAFTSTFASFRAAFTGPRVFALVLQLDLALLLSASRQDAVADHPNRHKRQVDLCLKRR